MRNSGFSAKYRKQILDSACNAFEEMLKADQNGEKPLFQDKHWNKKQRIEQKDKRRLNWYKKGGTKNGFEYKIHNYSCN